MYLHCITPETQEEERETEREKKKVPKKREITKKKKKKKVGFQNIKKSNTDFYYKTQKLFNPQFVIEMT